MNITKKYYLVQTANILLNVKTKKLRNIYHEKRYKADNLYEIYKYYIQI